MGSTQQGGVTQSSPASCTRCKPAERLLQLLICKTRRRGACEWSEQESRWATGCPASQANSRRFWDSLHQQGLFCQRFGILPLLTSVLGAGALLGAGLGEHRATLCIPPALPAAAKLSNVLTGCFAPSSAFKPSPPPAPFLIITGQTQPQPVAWLLFV